MLFNDDASQKRCDIGFLDGVSTLSKTQQQQPKAQLSRYNKKKPHL